MKLVYYFRQPDNKKEEYFMYVNNSLLEKSNEELYESFKDYKTVVDAVYSLNNITR